MSGLAMPAQGYPQAILPHANGGLPVEVTLIARLPDGAGDAAIRDAARRQRSHPGFVDALDEPSVRIGALHDRLGDRSTVFTFLVGERGHPFHRHAGHRMFTAIAGSAGAVLQFSTATDACDVGDALQSIRIPPDSLFVVRFGGGTWHRFLPGRSDAGHPALFAVSCHPDECSGALDAGQRAAVIANRADIPMLTELLPGAFVREIDAVAHTSIVLDAGLQAGQP